MAETIYTPEIDRLPWLTDEKAPKKPPLPWWFVGLGLITIMAVAAVSFWFGMAQTQRPADLQPTQSQAEVTTALPAPAPVMPMPEVEQAPMPQVEPAPEAAPVFIRQQEEVRVAAAPRARTVHRVNRAKASRPKAAAAKRVPEKKTLSYSNPWESADVSGRMVRIGAYGSLEKGRQAWSRLAQLSPSFKRLPAVVTDLPSRTGRVYYWLQVGTTSQAHSEVLCQRMRAIGQSCLVVDLAGARKGSGNERQPAGL